MGRWHAFLFEPGPGWSLEELAKNERFLRLHRIHGHIAAVGLGIAVGFLSFFGLVFGLSLSEPFAAAAGVAVAIVLIPLGWNSLGAWPPGPGVKVLQLTSLTIGGGYGVFDALARRLSVSKPVAGVVGAAVGALALVYFGKFLFKPE